MDSYPDRKSLRKTLAINNTLDQTDFTDNTLKIPSQSNKIYILKYAWNVLLGKLYVRPQNKSYYI